MILGYLYRNRFDGHRGCGRERSARLLGREHVMSLVALRHDAAAPVDRRRRRAGCVADRDRGLLQQLTLKRTLQKVERIAGEEEPWLEGVDAEPGCGRGVAHDAVVLSGTTNRCKPSHDAPSETHESARLVLGGVARNRQKTT